jgi:hypothetical protein
MTTAHTIAHTFFERYAAALLAREDQAIASMYSLLSLLLFPGESIWVADVRQTEGFFKQSWNQYEGVQAAHPRS